MAKIKKKTKKVTRKVATDFFIAGIGASAGGLEAFKEFLAYLPVDSDIAYVFIQHLSPNHKSLLPEILSRMTPLSVYEATHGTTVKPNCIYVIPSNVTLYLKEGKLQLAKRNPKEKPHLPIDRFFESLAHDQKERAIAVVLSGTGSDGADGSRMVKSQGGITFAQSPETARYDSMPAKAIIVDDIDFILSPKEIAKELGRLGHMNLVHKVEEKITEHISASDEKEFDRIMTILRQTTGTDFTQYKPTTIRRRISRRMVLAKLEHLKDYFKFLQENPAERLQLGEDVLINVTTFFREPESYDYFKTDVLPDLLKNKGPEAPLRIWVAGCSTGEEAYSIAICVSEVMGAEVHPLTVQIFATDLSEKCIEKARTGKYLDSISEHVSAERLSKYFTKLEDGYRVSKPIRNICIFTKHDLSRDPSFSKLDLISCRNLLIYLGQDLQQKVMESFHYSLNPNGCLILGGSESIGKAGDLFHLVEARHKVYTKKSITGRTHTFISRRDLHPSEPVHVKSKKEIIVPSSYEIQVEADRAILSRYSPPSVVINSKLEILQFRGNTEQFLLHKHGEASLNLIRMARETLGQELKKAIQKVKDKDISIREESIVLSGVGLIHFEIIPLRFLPGERCYLVVFETAVNNPSVNKKTTWKKKIIPGAEVDSMMVVQLKQELNSVKDNLQAVIQDFENANQELQSANEEIVSSNEELQSTNEELESSKEELQSTNEELNTVNEELQERNEDLFRLNNDLINVLNSVQIPIIIVGNDLSIRRYTASASKIFNFIPTDLGRPFTHITSNVVDIVELGSMVRMVLEHAVVQERDMKTKDGNWLHIRIRPYKTEEQKLEGAVITVQEIDDLKVFIALADKIIDSVEYPIAIIDSEFNTVNLNKSYKNTFKNLDIFGKDLKLRKIISTVTSTSKRNHTIAKKDFVVTIRKLDNNKHLPPQYLIAFGNRVK